MARPKSADRFAQAELAARRGADSPPLPSLRVRAKAALADPPLQVAMERAARTFRAGQMLAASDPDLPPLRERGRTIRAVGVSSLGPELRELEKNLKAGGFEVHHASDSTDACRIISEIAESNGVRLVVKSKSMATEEVHLNDALERLGIEVIETDLGEYIVQRAGERPAHIIAPAVHKSRSEIADLFSQIAGESIPDDHLVLTEFARHELRSRFLAADMGITGVNFACADTGTLAMVSNEGNLRMSTTIPRIHVALMPIEKVLPHFADLATMLPLLVRSATGQRLTSYVSLISGPRRVGETDGPEQSHVVILDNGRRRLIGTPYEDMLRCIRCAACFNVCPVYRKIGGHAYGGAYSGPMGAILGALVEETGGSELPFASTLCGACTDACPVGIPLHRLLYRLRSDRERTERSTASAAGFRVWSQLWSWGAGYRSSSALAGAAAKIGHLLSARSNLTGVEFTSDGRWVKSLPGPLGGLTDLRALPVPARVPFSAQWREQERRRPNPGAEDRGGCSASAGEETSADVVESGGNRTSDGFGGEVHAGEASGGGAVGGEVHAGEASGPKFIDRLRSNGFEVVDARGKDAAQILATFVESVGGTALVDAVDGPDSFRDLLIGHGVRCVTPGDPSASDATIGVSSAVCAIAETGSVVISNADGHSRLTSLLPATHVAVVSNSNVVESLAEAMALVREIGIPSGLAFISGPSKTADIELRLTTGVHGPGRVVALVTD